MTIKEMEEFKWVRLEEFIKGQKLHYIMTVIQFKVVM